MVVVLSASATNLSALPSGKSCKYAGQAVRALPIRIISVRSQGVQLIVDDYIQRLKLYCSVEDVHIKNNPKNASDWKVEDSALSWILSSPMIGYNLIILFSCNFCCRISLLSCYYPRFGLLLTNHALLSYEC